MFKIKELFDIFTDACVRDEAGNLVFLSLYGRDTVIQQLYAAFYLKATEGGFDQIHLVDDAGRQHPVFLGQADRLTKISGRFPRANLFGNLVHTWIYDPVVTRPDMVNRAAWLLAEDDGSDAVKTAFDVRVWEAYRQLSPVPLLDHWQAPVVGATGHACITSMAQTPYPPLGRVSACRVTIGEHFAPMVSRLVRDGTLTLEG
ncbi:MAG: hypothetical protein Q8O33_09665 [Pseudomonadota bacterium]|nr:hypothetical protein [Pseudomonadota bacterium]